MQKKWFLLYMFMSSLILALLIPSSIVCADSYYIPTGPYNPESSSYYNEHRYDHCDTYYCNTQNAYAEVKKELLGMVSVYTKIDVTGETRYSGNAVRFAGNSYYVDKEVVIEWLQEMNGSLEISDAYRNDRTDPPAIPTELLANMFKVTRIRYEYYNDYNNRSASSSYTPSPFYELIPLEDIAHYCGSTFTVSNHGNTIDLRSTENPDTYYSYADKYYMSLKTGETGSVKFTVEAHTFNVYNNDGIYVGFTYKKVSDPPGSLQTLSDFSTKRSADGSLPYVTKPASGVITYNKKFTLNFDPSDEGVYEFYLKAKDGVGRETPERTYWIVVEHTTTYVLPSLPGTSSGTKLETLEDEYGISPKHTGGPPAIPTGDKGLTSTPSNQPAIRAPATGKFMFSTKEYKTSGQGGCRSYDAPDMAYIIYKTNMGRDLQPPENPSLTPLTITGNKNNMTLCYYEERWRHSSCCSGDPVSCSDVYYIGSKKFIYRKIIEVPKGAGDNPLNRIFIKADDRRGQGPEEYYIDYEIYTPLRTTFQLEKVIDPKYGPPNTQEKIIP